jgi:protein TonB
MGSGFGDGSGNGLGDGSGNGSRNGASSGAESGAPLETRFGEMNAPGFIHQAMPVYPPLARRHGKEGRVVLTILIDQAGKVQKIDVTEPAGYGLTEAAIEAVKRSTFAPAYVNGKKVSSRAVLPIRFKLE